MTSPPPRRELLIVDDHPIITVAVKSLIEKKLPSYNIRTAHRVAEAMRLVEETRPAIAVVDLSLPDGDGLELVRRIRGIAPDCRVLVFSMQNELQLGPLALKAGARGYLMKGDKASSVITAIRKIESGGIYVSEALAQEMILSVARPVTSGIEKFSDREHQVFRLLAAGRSTKEISEQLRISTKTVDSHVEHMKEKTGCSNKTELVLQARDWWRETTGG